MTLDSRVFPAPADPISALLASLSETVQSCGLASLSARVDYCRARLRGSTRVAVSVLGGFKAGKSSFINFLAGSPVLPVGVLPLTAVVTQVRPGAAVRVAVTLASGETLSVSPAALTEWVTEDRNPGNRKGVVCVEVEAPGLARFPNLDFVDTPGLGSVFAHNTAASLAWLPRAEAVILASPCIQPFSEADASFARQVAATTPRLSVLLTKADLLSEHDRSSVLQFTRERLQELDVEASVFLWTQEAGFDQLRSGFISEFLEPLNCSPGEASREILSHKVTGLARETIGLLETGIAAARVAADRRRELANRLRTLCEGPASIPELVGTRAAEARGRSWERTLAVLDATRPALVNELTAALDGELGHWRGSLSSVAAEYERWAGTELRLRLAALAAARPELIRPLLDFSEECQRLVRLFQDQVAGLVRETLGVTLDLAPWDPQFEPPGAPDIAVGPTFMFNFGFLWAALPSLWLRPIFRRHLRRTLAWEIEKNVSRLAAQWDEALRTALAALAGRSQEYVRTQRTTLSTLLDGSRDTLAQFEAAKEGLQAQVLCAPR